MDAVKLLVVDDNDVFRRIVAQYLGATGQFAPIATAGCAAGALAAVRASQPDVIVLDLNLPDGSGLDLLPDLRAAAPGVKIIAVTLWDADVYRQAALDAGADDFIAKSAIHAQLLPAIERLFLPVG
jgi:DNA-binding NarL/FixJ family response regulator